MHCCWTSYPRAGRLIDHMTTHAMCPLWPCRLQLPRTRWLTCQKLLSEQVLSRGSRVQAGSDMHDQCLGLMADRHYRGMRTTAIEFKQSEVILLRSGPRATARLHANVKNGRGTTACRLPHTRAPCVAMHAVLNK